MAGPIEQPGWRTFSTTRMGDVTSTHSVPVEQFVHELSASGDCVCGPDVSYLVQSEGPDLPMIVHFALDPSYYEYRDWGLDGPVD